MPEADWQSLPEFVENATAKDETDVYRRALEQFDRLVIAPIVQKPAANRTGPPNPWPQPRHAAGQTAAHAVGRRKGIDDAGARP